MGEKCTGPVTGPELALLERREDRRHGVTGPASIFCPNGSIAAVTDTALCMAMMRELLREHGYGVAA